jgi:hypothetical protein
VTIVYVLVGVFFFALIILGTLLALSLDRRVVRAGEPPQEPLPRGDAAGHSVGHGRELPPHYVEV